ncbi:TetR family transcriptional regulator [Nocardioides sp. TRM66260-LWL]|uniref:TetR family transcriptional regulator n=1 Tax=Nocardioides sp. TRM66260-LWL TaxID=2874478 RepID=UPI001CC6E124|nr:TetR family transcriptional regulator [Nocardioides sp. TRM66260-LWL]MBZ5733424.1 TetR family transcriptional regulator [Nocardioides sp. TRM66260-LWL]
MSPTSTDATTDASTDLGTAATAPAAAPSPDEVGSAAQRERRKRILDATIALASEGGFDAVQMRSVAERADVALGTLYRYFPSKIHLLVSALGREFDKAEQGLRGRPVPGETAAERVITILKMLSRGLQADPHLTEALTRAFMFADSSATAEIHRVGMTMTSMLSRALHPDLVDVGELGEEDVAITKVIGDVWLSALVGWVTGRSTAADTAHQIEVAVSLLLRD